MFSEISTTLTDRWQRKEGPPATDAHRSSPIKQLFNLWRSVFICGIKHHPYRLTSMNDHCKQFFRCQVVCAAILAHCINESAADDVFVDQVVPVLQRRCLSCHHEGEAKGDFSLTDASGLVDSGYVDTDDVEASYLLELVMPENGKAEMPKDSEPLSADEIAMLRKWIEDGAKWPESVTLEPLVVTDRDWWSLRPIVVDEPRFDNANPVDAFVDAKLTELGLTPVEQADPLTLTRRLTYDLTGLPPTPAEVGCVCEGLASRLTSKHGRRLSIGCWIRPRLAKSGDSIGWMSCVTPRRMAMTRTSLVPTRGLIAIM